jgi:hypothetical protein
MWIKHIWPNIQGTNLQCNTRWQCYKNTGFLQYSFWVTGYQRPPTLMLAVSTLSLKTEHCTSELWPSYSLSNPRHHTNNLKFYTCDCQSMTALTTVYVPRHKSLRDINQGNVKAILFVHFTLFIVPKTMFKNAQSATRKCDRTPSCINHKWILVCRSTCCNSSWKNVLQETVVHSSSQKCW